jgi:hypothetical protein
MVDGGWGRDSRCARIRLGSGSRIERDREG